MTRWFRTFERGLAIGLAATQVAGSLAAASDALTFAPLVVMLLVGVGCAAATDDGRRA